MSNDEFWLASLSWGWDRGKAWVRPIVGGVMAIPLVWIEDMLVGIGPSIWSTAFWGGLDGGIIAVLIMALRKRLTPHTLCSTTLQKRPDELKIPLHTDAVLRSRSVAMPPAIRVRPQSVRDGRLANALRS